MKKITTWATIIAFIVFVIDWGIIGLKLLDNDYNIIAGAYIAVICLWVICGCAIYRVFSNKCPHCGKIQMTNGKYCPHCGKENK